MKKHILLFVAFLLFSITFYGANIVSAAGTGSWQTGSSWVGGVVPTSGDNVTITSGTQINLLTARACNNITINGTLNWSSNVVLTITGNYLINTGGVEQGTGTVQFNAGTGTTLTSNGTTSATVKYYFNKDFTINGSSSISKTGSTTQIAASKTVYNQSTFTMGSMLPGASSKFVNDIGGVLNLTLNGFMVGALFDASLSSNTVNLNYVTGSVPATTSGYRNLVINGSSGTKSLLQNTSVKGNLTINSGNTLAANGYDLTLEGNWVNNGSFSASTGHTVLFFKSPGAAQTLSGSGLTVFDQLQIINTGGVSISSGTYEVTGVLTVSSGNFNTNNNSFKLKSTASTTARIAQITTGSLSGDFIIERYISGRDTTWSDVSSPVQSTNFGDWANELYAVSYAYSPPMAYPTQSFFSESLQDFVPITSSTTAIAPGVGVELYLSGNFNYANFPGTAINTIGVPNYGSQNLTSQVSFSGSGENLVGNPFASSISWGSVLGTSSNLLSTYDVYDYTAGTYANFGSGTEIGSGQGFWVYATAASPTLVIDESAKTTSSNSTLRSNLKKEEYFILNLLNNNPAITYRHSLKMRASSVYAQGWDIDKDHPFRKSPNQLAPAIYSKIDSRKAAINYFNSNDNSYAMQLYVTVGITGNYKITSSGFEFVNDYNCVQLEDTKLNKMIDLKELGSYNFDIAVGDSEERFVLHFSKNGNCKSANQNTVSTFENSVVVLPSANGNNIQFNFDKMTPVTISVWNALGQTIVKNISQTISNQTTEVVIPEDFYGLYFIKVESDKGIITKKFVKK